MVRVRPRQKILDFNPSILAERSITILQVSFYSERKDAFSFLLTDTLKVWCDGIQIVQQYKSLQVNEAWTISIKLFKFGTKHEN